MKFLKAYLCIFVLCITVFSSVVQAEGVTDTASGKTLYARPDAPDEDKRVKIRLLSEKVRVKPGESIWVGVEQSIDPEWHTYWRNPGDTGAAPKVSWTLPAGHRIGDIHWPTPKKLPYDGFVNYGYDGSVVLLQKLQIPHVIMEGPLHLKADVEILVCKDICIPEIGTYELVLNNPDTMGEDNTAYLESGKRRLPAVSPSAALLRRDGDFVELRLTSYAWCDMSPQGCRDLDLFPHDWGIVDNTADAASEVLDGELIIRQKASFDRDWEELEQPRFVVAYTDSSGQRASVEFEARIDTVLSSGGLMGPAYEEGYWINGFFAFIKYFVLAILGGIILNLMPCVFPVLSMKALSLVKTAEKEPVLARIHGLAYTAGIILSFLVIAGVLIVLQMAGAQIGWGFQLQNPVVVSLLVYLVFLIGLNLLGFFEIGGSFLGRFSNLGSRYTQGDGVKASFFTGVLATLVATPCTAPFMGVAIGFALTQPALVGLLIFAALGFGLALPYLLLSFIPAVQRKLPKPGTWMVTFKQFLAFPMFLTCAWLIWVLSQQAGSVGVVGVILGMLGLAFAIWIIRVAPKRGLWRAVVMSVAIISALMTIAFLPLQVSMVNGAGGSFSAAASGDNFGQEFSQTKLDALVQGNRAVFVEMTAAWCITCKVNHATSLNTQATRDLFAEKDIEYLIGDWTNYDPEITEYLEEFDRNGVPLYVYYGPRHEGTGQRPDPVILPQILTPGIVAGALNKQ